MALTDDELLDFDQESLSDFDPVKAERMLVEQGDTYRAQLVAARWIDGWRQRDESPVRSEEFQEGLDYALRQVAAHLRQGDLLPGGRLHDSTYSGET